MVDVDSHELPITTTSRAAERYRDGVAELLAGWPTAAAALDGAIAADPSFALAYAARSRLHAMCNERDAAAGCMEKAKALVEHSDSERERSHVRALAFAVARSPEALPSALAHVERWPRDTLVFSLLLGAFGLLAFSGMPDHDQARVDLCERYAGRFADDDWWFLTHRGWSLAENGEPRRGRTMLERALVSRRENANGAHSLLHALFELGAGEEAEAFVADWLPGYDRSGLLHGHIAWHAALIALDRGDAERALDIFRDAVRPARSSGVPMNVVSDGASLLWRLDAYGHSAPKELWTEIADYTHQNYPNIGLPFMDVHLGLIEAAAGSDESVGRLLSDLESLDPAKRNAASPVARSLVAAAQCFCQKSYARCVDLLEPMADDVPRLGGSHAQRELVEDMLVLALMFSGASGKARAFLEKRLRRRPSGRDARWMNQASERAG